MMSLSKKKKKKKKWKNPVTEVLFLGEMCCSASCPDVNKLMLRFETSAFHVD